MCPATELSPLRDAKQFHICGKCPYYCRAEEGIHRCPWCRVTLRRACDCGAPIIDPSGPECAVCSRGMRAPALSQMPRPEKPLRQPELKFSHPGAGAGLRRRGAR